MVKHLNKCFNWIIIKIKFCKQEKFTKMISRLSPKKPQKRSLQMQLDQNHNSHSLLIIFVHWISTKFTCLRKNYVNAYQLNVDIFIKLCRADLKRSFYAPVRPPTYDTYDLRPTTWKKTSPDFASVRRPTWVQSHNITNIQWGVWPGSNPITSLTYSGVGWGQSYTDIYMQMTYQCAIYSGDSTH